DIDRINEAREKICKSLFALADSFKGNSTVKEKTLGLYAFLQEINAQQQLKTMELKFTEAGDFAKEKEYSQIYKIVIDLLDEYVDLLGEEEMSGEDYNQILDAGFSEARIGIIPPGMDMVTLGDITRTRLGDIKVLFFAGVNDGIIPAADAGAGLISQTERTLLSGKVDLAPTVREKSYIQRFYLYLNMTKPKDKLYISYSALSSDGSGLMPSYLIATVTELFGNSIQSQAVAGAERLSTPESSLVYLTEHFSKALSGDEDALWRDLYRWYMDSEEYSQRVKRLTEAGTYSYDPSEDNLDQDLARKLYGEFLKNSVTRLELYSKCAFAHFLQRGLKLSEREEFEITPLEIGCTVHSAIELFTKKMMDMDYGWSTLPEDLLESMTDQCVEETADTMFTDLFKASSRNEYMINRIKRLMKRTVWGLKKQMQSGLFEQGYAEYPINFDIKSKDADDLKVWMTGVIDRMDVYKKDDKVYVKIIDYKTGSRDFDITRFYNGLSMQLGVYLEGAMKELSKENPGSEVIPAGIFYYNVSDPIVRGEPGMTEDEAQNSVAKELRMKGLCNNDPEIARTMDMNGSGASSVLPVSFNKDGSIKESKAAVSTDNFEDMRRYLDKMICSLAGEILSGKGEINPYELKEETGCDYCTYRAVCRFDQSIEGFCFRECSEASWDDIGCHSEQSEES
ncbi:MAG: PD-(D/E)XK nuclease family protein, partial [Lachnospiraceae bacterium]|nr:PD-(D/E)XK nuclease family protein [Lachnospiraceae bacterium]